MRIVDFRVGLFLVFARFWLLDLLIVRSLINREDLPVLVRWTLSLWVILSPIHDLFFFGAWRRSYRPDYEALG
jgi:hypothetical protein